jgi:ABC-type glycerol-3-phosphate transport system permease component
MTGVAIRAKASMPAPMPRPAAIVVNGLLAGLAVVALFPLLWMLSVSFMAPGASSVYPPQLWPHEPTLDNYRELFARVGVGRYLANSLFVAVAATALSLFFNVTAGYAFAKLRFAGRDRIFRLMLGALVIPGQVAMVPLFLLLKQLGPILAIVGILTVAGYFQLFAEPYVMTQGGPLQSTVSVLYFMYEEGFKWWNLGNASAVAFLLFLLIFAVTLVQMRVARRSERWLR